MELLYGDKLIRVFTISPRTAAVAKGWAETTDTIQWGEKYNCSGMLIFTGNDTYIEPWVMAQYLLERTTRLLPLVAVNPVYQHPFTAAKTLASLARIYKRKIWLNMVTGTAVSHMTALGDELTHAQRYDRLLEYIDLIKALVCGKAVTSQGPFYVTKRLQLHPALPADLHPEFLLAGQSPAAQSVCARTGAVGMQMLQGSLASAAVASRGIHFGVVTRATEAAAWAAARAIFPPDPDGQTMLKLSMANTDSTWKTRMNFAAELPDTSDSGYWLEPFRNFKADCPYLIGAHERVAEVIATLIERGTEVFILDVPASEVEYEHVSEAFAMAGARLRQPPWLVRAVND
jgi:alkanesulfonate monooxygenase